MRRDDLEERGHLRLQRELRHLRAGATSTAGRRGRAGERELALRLRVGGARDDRQVGAARAGRERDVEVLRVGVGRREQPVRAVDPGARRGRSSSEPLPSRKSTPRSLRMCDRVGAEVEHDERLSGRLRTPRPRAARPGRSRR